MISEFHGRKDLQVKWYLSDVVNEEGKAHFVTNAKKSFDEYNSATNTLKSFFREDIDVTAKKEEEELMNIYDKMIEENHLVILKTKWEKISLEKLMNEACWKVEPFEGEKGFEGKGFKDSLIAKNLTQNLKKLIKTTKDQVIFFSNDQHLIKAVTDKHPNIEVKNSTVDLISVLRLSKTESERKFAYELTDKANIVFVENIFNEQNIGEKILGQYSEIFEHPHNKNRSVSSFGMLNRKNLYLRENIKSFNCIGTSFLRKYRGETFAWESNILVDRFYEEKFDEQVTFPVGSGVQDVYMANQGFTPVTTNLAQYYSVTEDVPLIDGNLPPYFLTQQYEPYGEIKNLSGEDYSYVKGDKLTKRQFEFVVKWNSKVGENGEITDTKVMSIAYKLQYNPFYPFVSVGLQDYPVRIV